MERLKARGVEAARVTLQVGLATFQPLRVERVEDHRMLEEIYTVPEEAAAAVERAKAGAGRLRPLGRPSSGRWKARPGRGKRG
jgi:S-adenosylmethionine--tRNA ribosyltransferase-isomerase